MKLFITGMTGFVGSAAANFFASAGHQVQGIGRKAVLPPYVSKSCLYSPADICKPLEKIDADVVIHSAALASDAVSFKEAYAVNVKGTENVLNAAGTAAHFIYISSSSVYNFKNGRVKYEKDSGIGFDGLSAYGQSKWLAEELVNESRMGFKKTILRPRAIYGKYDQLLIPRLLRLVRGSKIIVPGNLSRQISLTHINNLISAIELAICKQKDRTGIYNVSDSEVYDLNIVLPALLKVVLARRLDTLRIPPLIFESIIALNKKLKFNPSLTPFAAASLTSKSVMNIDKISGSLGYLPAGNFFSGCPEIARWIHKEQGWKSFFSEAPLRNF